MAFGTFSFINIMETRIHTFSISYDPNYMIISTEKDNEFIFYNANTHYALRCNELELHLLDLVYKYNDADYISHKVDKKYKEQVKIACQHIIDSEMLLTEHISENSLETYCIPSVYYLHLTYRCNLACTYCYNKDIRKNNKELSFEEWKTIIDKIIPHAVSLTLTGGEFFLYHDLLKLLRYIKEQKQSLHINCISNCMHDFSQTYFQEILAYIDTITFSCDSINSSKDRNGFDPELFRNNIKYLKEHNKEVEISISTTLSNATIKDIQATNQFAQENRCPIREVPLLPMEISQITNMVPIDTFKQMIYNENRNSTSKKALNKKQIRCGAARSTCSIDPQGNVYPCHLLHYQTFFMGNLLDEEIQNLRFINADKGKINDYIPNIDEISDCQSCKIRYICGGGCIATAYLLQGSMKNRNKLMCPYNYEIAMEKLRNIP